MPKKKAATASPAEDELRKRIAELEQMTPELADAELVARLDAAVQQVAERDADLERLREESRMTPERFQTLARKHPDWIPESEVGVKIGDIERRLKELFEGVEETSKMFSKRVAEPTMILKRDVRRLGIRS